MMNPKGKFVFIGENKEEHILFKRDLRAFCDNEVVSAYNGEEGFELLKKYKDDIFLIISDVSMPKVNGLELKRMIEITPELKIKAIPFIFYSIHDSGLVVKEAYSLGIQGFIKKSDDRAGSIENLDILIKLWSTIIHPNSLD